MRFLNGSNCQCQTGYYDKGDNICSVICDPSCATCANITFPSVCLTCLPTRILDPYTQRCVCDSGLVESGSEKCIMCSRLRLYLVKRSIDLISTNL